jgi:hypothetical protein
MIFTTDMSAQIMSAISAIIESNNGYAYIGNNEDIANAVRLAGFVVIRSNGQYKGFTKHAQECLKREPFGVSTYKPAVIDIEGPDYEGMILSRQENDGIHD